MRIRGQWRRDETGESSSSKGYLSTYLPIYHPYTAGVTLTTITFKGGKAKRGLRWERSKVVEPDVLMSDTSIAGKP
ncbi:hypothetical protein HZH68_008184 [Vespula germanica]|uniref:Uncharacterized protein n=1 Tax=Vespula germanica TaxID=30212 RepID=A0A834K3R4_VESGE|nr:hypothetical protein HZH68_008184 [Vespula germanica]